MNFDETCRICLQTCKKYDIDVDAILKDYKEFTGYTIVPRNEPRKVCKPCLTAMKEAVKFKKQCKETQTRLVIIQRRSQLNKIPKVSSPETLYFPASPKVVQPGVQKAGLIQKIIKQPKQHSNEKPLIETPESVQSVNDEAKSLSDNLYCKICDPTNKVLYKKKEYLDKHIEVKHIKKFLIEICPICGKTCNDLSILHQHRMSSHIAKNQMCQMNFNNAVDLKSHQDTTSDTTSTEDVQIIHDSEHLCSFCGKSFLSAEYLKEHSLCHRVAKSYQCTLCASKFTLPVTLKTHMARMHSGITNGSRSRGRVVSMEKKMKIS